MRYVLAALVLAGCAQGRATVEPVDADSTPMADAPPGTDAGVVDAAPPVDAKMVDATTVVPPDAPPDAYVCTVMTMQLLANPVFDLDAGGTGWVQQNIDNAFPIITDQDGAAEHSAPYKAWLGGWTGAQKGVPSVTDVLHQDVTVPMGTTQLRLTGFYWTATTEPAGAVAYDTAQVALVQTNGTPIETVLSQSNLTTTQAWTAIDKTFTANLSGQTVRLRFTSTNDDSFVSNFYFDTLALTATYCL